MDSEGGSQIEEEAIKECPELAPTEPWTESEYSKLSAAYKKLANDIEIIMGNISSIRITVNAIAQERNSLSKHVKKNSDQITDIDYEHGHYVLKVGDLQRAVGLLPNEADAIKGELIKKDSDIDEIERQVKRRNLLISGVAEDSGENLYIKATNILRIASANFTQRDIDCTYRLGQYVHGKSREIVVELFSKFAKDDILKGRKKLKEFDMTRNVWINEDLPTRVRKTRGVMREIVRRAEEKGIPCTRNGDKLIYKNMTYGQAHLKALPIGIRPDDLKTRVEGNRIGFMSEDSYLSNYYKCPVTVDDYTFASAEHAIQYKKSLVCKGEDVGIQVKRKLKMPRHLGTKSPPVRSGTITRLAW